MDLHRKVLLGVKLLQAVLTLTKFGQLVSVLRLSMSFTCQKKTKNKKARKGRICYYCCLNE